MSRVLTVRLPDDEHARLAGEAKAAGMTLAEWVRGIVLQGHRPVPRGLVDGIASHDEVLAMLTAAAKSGDVQAMRHLERVTAPPPAAKAVVAPEEPKVSPVDQLAARRRRVVS